MNKKNLLTYSVIFISGFGIAYFTLPTKSIIKKVEVESEVDKKTISELTSKVNSLEKTNKTLKERVRTVTISTPDGTTQTETVRDTETSESKEKEIKETYETKISILEREISELKELNKIEMNKKYLGIEAGYMSNRAYYGHITYDIFNHVFIGGHVSVGKNQALGAGIGIRL